MLKLLFSTIGSKSIGWLEELFSTTKYFTPNDRSCIPLISTLCGNVITKDCGKRPVVIQNVFSLLNYSYSYFVLKF